MDEVVVFDRAPLLHPEKDGLPFPIGLAGRDQLLGLLPVERKATALIDGLPVPVEPEPAQVVQDLLEEADVGPDLVGVFYPEEEASARVPGIEPVEEGGPGAPEMEVTGRAGGESYGDHVFAPKIT